MDLRITIDIFSGRPNPVIELRGRNAAPVLERLTPGRTLRPREARVPQSTLGYRGLIIEQVGGRARKLPRRFRVAGGVLEGEGLGHEAADPAVEEFICGTTGPIRGLKVERGFPDFCRREIRRYVNLRKVYPWKKYPWPLRRVCRCAPLYEPDWWNDGGMRQWNNNCYNYGCNDRTDTFAQPGKAAGAMYTSLSCASVKPAAIADALINAPGANNKCPAEGHLVALVIAPGWDFHWYRKGRNGRWTHKPGGTQVTHLDNAGAIITDPRTADRGPYTQFCSFMIVMHGHIKIQ
jgi:hypothetical protein